MSKITPQILDQAKTFVLDVLDRELPEACVFHSPEHTIDVHKNALIIGNEIGLSVDELYCLGLSALFHDIGYVKAYEGHEQESINMAKEFLSGYDIDDEHLKQVERAILATHVPQQPKDIISEALCDADLMHLTYPDYFDRIITMRMEWKLTGRADLTELEFHKQSIIFFNKHSYHTEYGRKVLSLRKQFNLKRIEAIIIQ